MAYLIVASSPGKQKDVCFKLPKRPVAGGRDPGREIQILDPHVSRRHFVIQQDGETHIIKEAKAKNGILVNGFSVTEKKLADGDQIQVGETLLTYYVSDKPDKSDALHKTRAGNIIYREKPTL